MFDINQVYKINNFLTQEERMGFDELCSHYVWDPIGHSYDKNQKTFWLKDLWLGKFGQCYDIEQAFRNKLEVLLNVRLQTEKMYLNGQSHGQTGSLHSDLDETSDPNSKYITLVYYVNEEWNPEYGGFTVIVDKNQQLHTVYPEPNSVVIFDSSLPHAGLEPTSKYPGVRVTMAHKFRIVED